MDAVDIGGRLELMVDDWLVERLDGGAAFRLHSPSPREVSLVMERPWEAGSSHHGYMTVFQDEGRYRMYYAVRKTTYAKGERTRGQERICYAESADGREWNTPNLGRFEFEGATDNNIVWLEDGGRRRGIHGFTPFRDPSPGCRPESRYKALAALGANGGPFPARRKGLVALGSPDGLDWSMLQDGPVITDGAFDSQNLAFWDSVRGEYRAYWRDFFRDAEGKRYRGIQTATSPDFLNWGEARWLYYPGAEPEELYTNQVAPYFRAPHIFLGFPARYVQRTWTPAVEALPEQERRRQLVEESGNERMGTAVSDTVFMSSRDGTAFHRWGEAFVRPGLRHENNWFYGDNYVNWGLVTTAADVPGVPDELSFYVSEASRGDVTGEPAKAFRRHVLRLDGFVSVNGPRKGGEMTTRPLVFSGKELVLNFAASAAGSVRAEVQDIQGCPLPGFAMEDCVEVLGDDLKRAVGWQSGADLGSLSGKPVKLRFRLTDADLYAIRFR